MGDNYAYGETEYGLCPSWALSLGYLGVAAGAVLSNWGSAVSFYMQLTVKLFWCRTLDKELGCMFGGGSVGVCY